MAHRPKHVREQASCLSLEAGEERFFFTCACSFSATCLLNPELALSLVCVLHDANVPCAAIDGWSMRLPPNLTCR